MPKRRRRAPGHSRVRPGASGNPARRALSGPDNVERRARARLAEHLTRTAASDPLLITATPALFLSLVSATMNAPSESCIDDCAALVHAYAHLGVRAHVRAAALAIVNVRTGAVGSHGALLPEWEDDRVHGHAVVWLPGQGHLFDVTAEQFPLIAAHEIGPVIVVADPAPEHYNAEHAVLERLAVDLDPLSLEYVLAAGEITRILLDHPVVRGQADNYRRRGVNIATAAVHLLARNLPPGAEHDMPLRRAAALVAAARDLPDTHTSDGALRFVLARPNARPQLLDASQLPLPDGTPPALQVCL
ncbi:hypothetical protein [Nonomuraea jabiensis]|uniref:hypothetical protein n=1 Tax=Nonomuraea jabiensis TaxID=882448 RepID=UPI003D71A0FD